MSNFPKQERLRISVCLATYNGEKHIVKQLKSILSQLPADAEVIVSDDHSKDGTLGLIKSFNDPRISIIKNKKKTGPIGNFENALEQAKGDVIFLSDQDDIWTLDKVEIHMEAHTQYDLVISDAIVVNDNDEILFESFFNQRNSKPGLIKNLIKNSYIGCCMSFNKRILEIALPFPENIHMHDWWIGLIAERFGSVKFVPSKTLRYLRHNNNASQTLIKRLPLRAQLKNRFSLLYNLFTITNKK